MPLSPPRSSWPALALALALALLLPACTPAVRGPQWAKVSEQTPAALLDSEARDPSVAADTTGRIALTWVASDTAGSDVWVAVSRDSGARFAPPVRVNEKRGQVASYPESRPLVALGPAGRVLVAWAARRDTMPEADDIMVRVSEDDGAHFAPAVALNSDHLDPRSTYHGFLALAASPAGEVALAWIDGRASLLAPGEDEPARAQVRVAVSRDGGTSWSPDAIVASDVCSCCRLGMQLDDSGRIAIAYRSAREDLRDPRLALSVDHGVSFGLDTLVSLDHWHLNGCPSIGPTLTLANEGGFYAWTTGSDSTADHAPPGSYYAAWHFSGRSGPRRAVLDGVRDGPREANRPMLAAFERGALLGVLAIPAEDSTRHVLAVRRLDVRGAAGPWLFLGTGVRSAALAAAGERRMWAAWVEKLANGPRVRLARIIVSP